MHPLKTTKKDAQAWLVHPNRRYSRNERAYSKASSLEEKTTPATS